MARLEPGEPAGIPRGLTPVVHSYEDIVVREVRAAMLVLFGAVGIVLLIATANVANLLLMRGEARPDGAGRASGAGRWARQAGAPAARRDVVLPLAAGAVGLMVTWWSLQALVGPVPNLLPRVDSVHIDAGVSAFTLGVAMRVSGIDGGKRLE